MTVSIEQVLTFNPQDALGHRFGGRYRIDSVLATGGMGLLFAGTDERANRQVAIKLLKPQDGMDKRRVRRFLREVELAAQLRHPHIVDVLDLGTSKDGRAPYLVMELMSGRSLQAELEHRGRMTPEETLTLLLPIMDALACVHAARVIHRDIKPANIFLHRTAYGSVVPKLIDFGIAKVEGEGAETLTGGVLGTPAYMAPEQLAGSEIGPFTDVWAMGAVFYRCLSGAPPFVGSTPAETIAKIATASARPLEVEGTRRTLGAAIDRALIRRAELRYGSMRAFSSALLASARAAGIEVVLPASLERTLECAVEETTVGESWPWAAAGGLSARRGALLALAFLIPACSAMLLLRDAPVAEGRPVDRLENTANPRVVARTPAAVRDVPVSSPDATFEHSPRTTASSTAIEKKQRTAEMVIDPAPSRVVRSRANPAARRRAPVADAPQATLDAGLELLVEW